MPRFAKIPQNIPEFEAKRRARGLTACPECDPVHGCQMNCGPVGADLDDFLAAAILAGRRIRKSAKSRKIQSVMLEGITSMLREMERMAPHYRGLIDRMQAELDPPTAPEPMPEEPAAETPGIS